MMRHITLGACFILVASIMTGCGDKADPLSAPVGGDNGNFPDVPSYVQDVKSILDQYCISCHSTSKAGSQRNGAPPTVNLDTYQLAISNIDRANARIQAGTMPPGGGLDPAQRVTVQDWLTAGVPRGEP